MHRALSFNLVLLDNNVIRRAHDVPIIGDFGAYFIKNMINYAPSTTGDA